MNRRNLPAWALLAGDHAWELAKADWLRGDPRKLAVLLRSDLGIPDDTRQFLAAAIAGEIKPDARGKHRRIKPEASRAEASRQLSRLRTLRDDMLADADRIEATAEHRGCETQDVRQWIRESYNQALQELAARAGVSPKTLKNSANAKTKTPRSSR